MKQVTDGIHILQEKIKQAPTRPGVYRMLNEAGDVLYVGKAKHLKKTPDELYAGGRPKHAHPQNGV